MEIARSELQKVTYVDGSKLGERTMWLQPYFDGRSWRQWVPTSNGELFEIQPLEFSMGPYYAADQHVVLRSYHTEPLRRIEGVCEQPWERFVPADPTTE